MDIEIILIDHIKYHQNWVVLNYLLMAINLVLDVKEVKYLCEVMKT